MPEPCSGFRLEVKAEIVSDLPAKIEPIMDTLTTFNCCKFLMIDGDISNSGFFGLYFLQIGMSIICDIHQFAPGLYS